MRTHPEFEQFMQEQATTATEQVRAGSDTVIAQTRELVKTMDEFERARDMFFAYGHTALNNDPPLADTFETKAQYYQFLAHVGRRPGQNIKATANVLKKSASAIDALHTPGTMVYLATDVQGNHLIGTQYAVGHITQARARLLPGASAVQHHTLVIDVETNVTHGEPRHSEVCVQDITDQFEPYHSGDARAIAIGKQAVGTYVEKAFDSDKPTEFNWLKPTAHEYFLRAMCYSGLTLAACGISPQFIDGMRSRVIGELMTVRDGQTVYRSQVLKLPGLLGSNGAGLATIQELLGGRDPEAIDHDLARDIRTLQRLQSGQPA
ncbi:MAG TPA: hypothetical protein VLE73_00650 [Candidatus Saccharimonadales bacterium]|nr:hypothetical protein [Candidatus Saccharimonadales bacterium]